jgi:hypothetical protein
MLDLLRELFLNIFLHSAKEERSQYRLKLLYNSQIDALVVIYTLTEGVREPFLEVLLVREDRGHQEMHERPQFHNIILQWRSSQ